MLAVSSKEFVERKPCKVIILKIEVFVNMKYVVDFGGSEAVYIREAALCYFKEQSDTTQVPFIFLSSGVLTKMFQETLRFAKEVGSHFNRFVCSSNLGKGTSKNSDML